jgi:integrase
MKSDYLKPETFENMYRVMQRDNVLAIRISLETGLRIDDVLRLRWSDFQKGRKFTYIAKKTGKKGAKSISAALKRELFARDFTKSQYLFPGRKRGKHRTRQAVWKDVKQAAEKMGVVLNASPHSARKTYAVELRKEKGLAEVQKELQHSDMSTTILYAFADVTRGGGTPQTNDMNAFAELVAKKVVNLLLPLLKAKEKDQD